MGLKVPFIGGNGFNSPRSSRSPRRRRRADRRDPWFGDKNDPKVKAFVAKYEKAYGKKPDQFAAQAYDAFYIMTNALKAAGPRTAQAARRAAATKNFQGSSRVLLRRGARRSHDAQRPDRQGGKFAIFN